MSSTFFVSESYEKAYYRYVDESKKHFGARGYTANASSLTFSVNEDRYVCIDMQGFVSRLRAGEIGKGSLVVLTFKPDDVIMASLKEYKINLIERG